MRVKTDDIMTADSGREQSEGKNPVAMILACQFDINGAYERCNKYDTPLKEEKKGEEGEWMMSEKRLNNTIFLMFLVTENYKKAHHLSNQQFLDMNREYAILSYIAECPDIFDSMSSEEMVEEIDQYVSTV